ncbi:MAG: hypothetical protein Q8929_17315, partial [Bacillota bacterium]|nr:hypothetical protein [Bacillota bacterium]
MSTEKFSPATTVLSLSSVRPFIGSLFRADDRIEEIKLVQPPLSARQLEISALSQATFDLHQTFCQNLHRLVLADASLRFDPSAAASFTAAILSASRKRQLDALYAAPENFGLPHQLSELVQSFLRFHPVLRTGASYPLWTKNLEGMLGRGEIDQLIQISKVSPLFEAITRNQPEITLVALNELGADHQDEEG